MKYKNDKVLIVLDGKERVGMSEMGIKITDYTPKQNKITKEKNN